MLTALKKFVGSENKDLVLHWKQLIAKHPRWNKQQKAEAFIAIASGSSATLEVINVIINTSISQERYDYLAEHTSYHNLGKFNNSLELRHALQTLRRDLGLTGELAGHYSLHDPLRNKTYVGISSGLIERVTGYFNVHNNPGLVGVHTKEFGIESIEVCVSVIIVPVEDYTEILLIEKFYLLQTNPDGTAVCNLNIMYAGGSRKPGGSVTGGIPVFISHNGVCIGHFISIKRCSQALRISKETITSLVKSGILYRDGFTFTNTLSEDSVYFPISDKALDSFIHSTYPFGPSSRNLRSGPVTTIYKNSDGQFITEHHDHIRQVRDLFYSRGFEGIDERNSNSIFLIDSGKPYRTILTFSTSRFPFIAPDQLALFKSRLVPYNPNNVRVVLVNPVYILYNGECIGHFTSYTRCGEALGINRKIISSHMKSGIPIRKGFTFTSTLPVYTVINLIADNELSKLLHDSKPSGAGIKSGPVTTIYKNSDGQFITEHHDSIHQVRDIFYPRGFGGIDSRNTNSIFLIDSGTPYINLLVFSTPHFPLITPDQLALFKSRLVPHYPK